MQQHRWHRAIVVTAAATIGAFTLGVLTESGPVGIGGATALACGTTAAMLILIRQWLAQHAAELRKAIANQQWASDLHANSVEDRLDRILQDLLRERAHRERLQAELRDLTEEHNKLILETLQANNDRFAHPTWGRPSLSPRTSSELRPRASHTRQASGPTSRPGPGAIAPLP